MSRCIGNPSTPTGCALKPRVGARHEHLPWVVVERSGNPKGVVAIEFCKEFLSAVQMRLVYLQRTGRT